MLPYCKVLPIHYTNKCIWTENEMTDRDTLI